ncbi:MAG: mechanosensitive ion channel family protein [Gammaproteobacteria bacterium]|nr:mechanosensitive ion channel family protein [Gammaproteobacteria bacterium]
MDPLIIDEALNVAGVASDEARGVLAIFSVVFLTGLLAYVVARIMARLEQRFARTRNLWDDTVLEAARKPVVFFIWLQGTFWAAEVAKRYADAEVFAVNQVILRIGVIWLLAWFVVRLVRLAEDILVSPERMKQPMDETTVSALGKLLRATVIITATLVVLQSLGYSISGVLAFGGIGGIAVGFAAKDLLANFFGGLMIYMDRPFKVGDWIRSPDKNIEGTVEHIGWRLTTIRTFDKRPLYVPNATFTTITVENPSRMTHRRIHETIGIRYADLSKMTAIVEDVKGMLTAHEEIDTRQTMIVNFNAFNASSVDFFVYTFTHTTAWVRFHEIKQDVLLRIAEIIDAHGAQIALPTQTLHVPDGVRLHESSPEFMGLNSTSGPASNPKDAS